MAVLTVRVDDATRTALESLGRARGVTMSALLRGQMDQLLGRGARDAYSEAPITLSMVERRTLAQQHEILALLDDGARECHEHQREALVSGYTAEYADGFGGYEPELSPARCELVWDILDMFTVLEVSIRGLSDDELTQIDGHGATALRFRGFDGTDHLESRLLRYARYLIATDRWSNLADRFDSAHDRGNSQAGLLPSYRRMLAAFDPIWQAKLVGGSFEPAAMRLTQDELGLVARARPYSCSSQRTTPGIGS